MTYQTHDIVLSDSYVPELGYREKSNSIILLATEDEQKRFMLDTALYYTDKKIPVVFVLEDPSELERTFSTLPESERLRGNENLTYHTGTLEQLCSLLVIAEEKRKVRPVVIFLKSLPEILTEEVKDILRFAESVRTLFTQVIMFSPTLCDYFYDNIKNIAVLGYYEDANEERIMKVQFVERV